MSATSVFDAVEKAKNRTEFLLAMYKVMWDNISRHILVVWQSLTTLFAAIATAFLSKENLIEPDLGATIVIVTALWALAQTIDSMAWFNRNLLILTNIERQFLYDSDASDIHFYFKRDHPKKMIMHLRIQATLSLFVLVITLEHHLHSRVWPGFSRPWSSDRFEFDRAIPYAVLAVGGVLVQQVWSKSRTAQAKLKKHSPGGFEEISEVTNK